MRNKNLRYYLCSLILLVLLIAPIKEVSANYKSISGNALGISSLSSAFSVIAGVLNAISTPYFYTADHTIAAGEANGLDIYNSLSTGTFTLAQAGTTGFGSGVVFNFMNMNTGAVTISTTTSVFNGISLSAGSIVLSQYGWATCVSDAVNWNCMGQTSSSGSGTVSTGTQYQFAKYAATGTTVSGDSGFVTNSSGSYAMTGTVSPMLTVTSNITNGAYIYLNGTFSGYHQIGISASAGFDIFDVTSSVNMMYLVQNGSNSTLASFGSGSILGFTSANAQSNAMDVAFSRTSSGVMALGNGSAAGNTNGVLRTAAIQSVGTKFTVSGCSAGTTVGGATVGKFTLGANTCSVVVSAMPAAPNGYSCHINDETGTTILIEQSASTTTSATFSVPVTAGTTDVLDFACMGY